MQVSSCVRCDTVPIKKKKNNQQNKTHQNQTPNNSFPTPKKEKP